MATTKEKPITITAFTCESCCELRPLPKDGCGPCDKCRKEDTDADLFNDTIGAAQDAFWRVVAERDRASGVTTGDMEPTEADRFMEASTNAVAAWLLANKAARRKDQRSDAKDDSDDDDGLTFAQKWDPDRDFHARVSAEMASFVTLRGWSVSYDYPGYFGFRHEKRPNFTILATPDHGEEGFIAIDAQDDHGHNIDLDLPDIEWPLAARLVDGKVATSHAARVFLNLMSTVLEKHEPKKLVVEYDVTGWTEDQIDELCGDAAGTEAHILRSEVVPMEDK